MIYSTADDRRIAPILHVTATPAKFHPIVNAPPRYVIVEGVGKIILINSVSGVVEEHGFETKEEGYDTLLVLCVAGKITPTDQTRLRGEIKMSALPHAPSRSYLG